MYILRERETRKNGEIMSKETIEEFLARGGKITKVPERKAKGFVSMSSKLVANSAPGSRSRAKRAEDKASRRLR